ncbi:MAG: EAL domain-containing protein [Lachnospiraceae bacterium]|nr:EAL domain-containing protein [Lachnospiraceae bacterium]
MICFDHLALSEDILTALRELNIDYVFQPIYEKDKKTVYAWEALMRPQNVTVTDLIAKYQGIDKLHVIEVATFFGAMQAYFLRGYEERVAINSFPSDCMKPEEAQAFWEYYGDEIRGRMIIEILEYPFFSLEHWLEKNRSVRNMNNLFSLDDYGSGINNIEKVDFIKPDIVKIDRSLISFIDQKPELQESVKKSIELFHERGIKVVAEGIEREEEFNYLVSIGTDLFQGYYLARPN